MAWPSSIMVPDVAAFVRTWDLTPPAPPVSPPAGTGIYQRVPRGTGPLNPGILQTFPRN